MQFHNTLKCSMRIKLAKCSVLCMSIQFEEAMKTQTHVLTLGNAQAVETEDARERQSIDDTVLHWPHSEEAHNPGGLEECRPTEQALIISNQLGASNAETDC